MSSSSNKKTAKVQIQEKRDAKKAISTSMQPYHYGTDFLHDFEGFFQTNMNFVTKRNAENFKTAVALMTASNPSVVIKEGSQWWETFNRDCQGHFAESFKLSKEIKAEIDDFVETEEAIAKAEPQELFENSPV